MERFGSVVKCSMPKDQSGKAKGFAFVTMRSASEAEAAINGDIQLDGRTLRVNAANDKSQKKTTASTTYGWGKPEEDGAKEDEPDEDALKADFGLSGALAKDERTGNTRKGVVLKFVEPDDAAKPKDRWRIYVYKDDDIADTLHIHRMSAFLVGRNKDIAEIWTPHPSCSSQHAVLQFRRRGNRVLPYVMDLGSTNGTFLNENRIDKARYYELRHKDILKFANSSRDYVILREKEDLDDNI